MIDLRFEDVSDFNYPATLDESLPNEDLVDSLSQCISVQYNEIDLGHTEYGFNQPFVDNEANLYFERMHEFSENSINDIRNNSSPSLHFYKTDIRGNIKAFFDKISPKISKANPLIFHFALNPDNDNHADRNNKVRNPRIYFMVGRNGMIHMLFFDPYHEINP